MALAAGTAVGPVRSPTAPTTSRETVAGLAGRRHFEDRIAVMLSTDRQRGTFLGLAIGDALGAAVEFEPPGTFPAVTGYRGGGPHGLAPGEWTDDSSMTLALADSIVSVGWNPNDQARRYLAWYEKGWYSVNGRCFDIGMRCRSALIVSPRPGTPRPPATPRSMPAATARSCGWPRCRYAMSTCTPTGCWNWSCS